MPPRPLISWGAIFGGTFSALGIWLLLYAFGLAVGLSTIDPNDAHSLKGSGIFTGIWGLLTPLIALFVGSLVAARVSGVPRRSEGAAHGLVMWGLTTVAGAYMVFMMMGAVLAGVVSLGKTAVQAGGAAVGAAATGAAGAGATAQNIGIDADDALGPVNQRLREEGKPAVTADQLKAATQDVMQTAVREGRMDRQVLTTAIARNTQLSQADADEIAGRLEQQFNARKEQLGNRVQEAARTAQTGALKAAEASGKAFWGVFGALLLGLIAALIGGALGVPGGRGRRRERVATPVTRPVPPPREVYP
jgi:hypothetical protein